MERSQIVCRLLQASHRRDTTLSRTPPPPPPHLGSHVSRSSGPVRSTPTQPRDGKSPSHPPHHPHRSTHVNDDTALDTGGDIDEAESVLEEQIAQLDAHLDRTHTPSADQSRQPNARPTQNQSHSLSSLKPSARGPAAGPSAFSQSMWIYSVLRPTIPLTAARSPNPSSLVSAPSLLIKTFTQPPRS